MSLAITITDPSATILFANSAFEKLCGYSVEELIGKKQSIHASGETPLTTYKEMWEAVSTGECWQGRLLNKRKNGAKYFSEIIIVPILSENGVVSYFLALHSDVTELFELERRFSSQKSLTESVINTAPFALAVIDTEGRVVLDNLAYKTLMDDLRAEPAERFLGALRHEIGDDLAAACKQNRSFSNIEVEITCATGRKTRWYSCSGNWIKDLDMLAGGATEARTGDALLLVCTDISIQRFEYQRAKYSAVRAMMVEQQMTDRTREIVSAATFQLQGTMNVIGAMMAMTERRRQIDPSLVAALDQVMASGQRAIATLEGALPKDPCEPITNINVNEALREVLVVTMDRMSSFDVAVDWHPCREPVTIQGRPYALRNMFKNLLDNAIEAVEAGSDPLRQIRVITKRASQDTVEISVEDTGPGMTREVRASAFEPFFSAWPHASARSGVGLSIARQIANDHGGNIEIDERFRSGTRFRVTLPIKS